MDPKREQGADRRRSQAPYPGEERRKPKPPGQRTDTSAEVREDEQAPPSGPAERRFDDIH